MIDTIFGDHGPLSWVPVVLLVVLFVLSAKFCTPAGQVCEGRSPDFVECHDAEEDQPLADYKAIGWE